MTGLDEGCTVLTIVIRPAQNDTTRAYGRHVRPPLCERQSQRWKISHERLVADSVKPGGTDTGSTGSWTSST